MKGLSTDDRHNKSSIPISMHPWPSGGVSGRCVNGTRRCQGALERPRGPCSTQTARDQTGLLVVVVASSRQGHLVWFGSTNELIYRGGYRERETRQDRKTTLVKVLWSIEWMGGWRRRNWFDLRYYLAHVIISSDKAHGHYPFRAFRQQSGQRSLDLQLWNLIISQMVHFSFICCQECTRFSEKLFSWVNDGKMTRERERESEIYRFNSMNHDGNDGQEWREKGEKTSKLPYYYYYCYY